MGKKYKDLEVYLVGGAVRDELLGVTPSDLDYLVLNTSKDEMVSIGFQPVGKSYEVFLHPETKNEYTLAKGPLKEELSRRDLTINSMARRIGTNKILDPFEGRRDLKAKILRRTSDRFADDPIRIFRLARFKSQLADFKVDSATESFVKNLIITPGFFNQTSTDRLRVEISKALLGPRPDIFLKALNDWKVVSMLFPELEHEIDKRIEAFKKAGRDCSILWGILLYQAPNLAALIGASSYHQKLAHKLNRYGPALQGVSTLCSARLLELILGVEALRNERLLKDFCGCSRLLFKASNIEYFLTACEAVKKAKFQFNSSDDAEAVVSETRLSILKQFLLSD